MNDSVDAGRAMSFRACVGCGQEQALGLRFCGGCGEDLDAQAQSGSANTTMDAEISRPALSLLQGWGCFFAGVITLNVSCIINIAFGCIMYLAIGIFMSRFVMQRLVEWHPNYNTLSNIVSAKVWMVILWPPRMFMLLLQLTANKIF